MTTSNATPWFVLGALIVLSGLIVSHFASAPTPAGSGDEPGLGLTPPPMAADGAAPAAEPVALAMAPVEAPSPEPVAYEPPPPPPPEPVAVEPPAPAPVDEAPAAAAAPEPSPPPAPPVKVATASPPAPPPPAPQAASVPAAAAGPTLDGSDFGPAGATFSGTAAPGGVLKLYVDGQAVGQFSATRNGKWYFRTKAPIVPGPHTAIVNHLGPDGAVLASVQEVFNKPSAP